MLLTLLTVGASSEIAGGVITEEMSARIAGGVVSDGVYALRNKATGKYLDIQYDSPEAGMHIQQYAYGSVPSTVDTRSGLFKFTHRGGNNYLIRTMRNNGNSFYRKDDTSVLTKPIETVDIDNPMEAHWILSDAGNGYVYLRAYGTSKYLCTPSSGVNNNKYCTTETLASGGDRAKWEMVRYTGSAMSGVFFTSWTDIMTSGETYHINAYMYTTDMSYHGPVRYSITAQDGSSTNLATIDADGNVTVNGAGQFRVRMTYAGTSAYWYGNVTAKLADGVYFLQNRQTERYMQVDDDDAPTYSKNGGIMEIHPLDGGDYQRWTLVYLEDGYYQIKSVASGYAVTVPTGKETDDNVNLILKPYSGTNNQKWRITLTRNGSYKIKAKSSESYTSKDLVMDLQTALYTNGTNIRQREYLDNDSYKDEWVCIRMLPTNGFELAYEPSKWAGVVETHTNCYAYAINNQLGKDGDLWRPQYGYGVQQPGLYAENPISQSDMTSTGSNIISAVTADFNEYNANNDTDLLFAKVGKYEKCANGMYKVALVVNPGVDYHWYRQDSDGLWSHKPGITPVRRTDNSQSLIIDPEIANRGDIPILLAFSQLCLGMTTTRTF